MKRGQAEEQIKALGALAKSSVVKDLSYLVTNDPGSGSAKNKKAREWGIPIIDEEQFLALLAEPEKAAAGASSGAARRGKKSAKKKSAAGDQQGELF